MPPRTPNLRIQMCVHFSGASGPGQTRPPPVDRCRGRRLGGKVPERIRFDSLRDGVAITTSPRPGARVSEDW